ncbi:uroporphyrinogen-III synthase [Sinomonas cyclohexanicum]|uniref:Uroporphyrinogen-III synthase n=1 Tax=Sinomonas cyclohexanicum TaxID=322009 RepID=A0ABM7PTB5_SINCY|nr:uroporphyrinogen-III synthase [Corynebacterium cyclohexanicum]BCT75487.1 uroporphyrinogen-III synthase [Corynebacterium cyclohexanicum]
MNDVAAQLKGYRIGVTSHRRSEDLIEALERRGAEVMHAPVLTIAPVGQDLGVLEDTRLTIASRPDLCIVTTAYGMRRWLEVADAAGLGEALQESLSGAALYVRGPKARGAVRAAGLADVGIAGDETTATLVDLVLRDAGGRLDGKRVVMQLHGYTDRVQLDRLRDAGAELITVTPYRWVRPEGGERIEALIHAVCAGELDVLTFTSAPAVDALFSTAHELGVYPQLITALRQRVATAVVGPVTAAPLEAAGLRPWIPERFRMGALVKLVTDNLGRRTVRVLPTSAGAIELRGRTITVGDSELVLAPSAMLLFRTLFEAGGAVVPRETLARLVSQKASNHALDMAVNRLRGALPAPELIQTVVKRGYRLRVTA